MFLNKKILRAFSLIILAVFLIAGFVFVYQKFFKKIPATTEKPNIILISVDTLRADHLGTYGYKKDTSPNIDEFAKKSIVFENAFTPIPFTISSYASLFTGTYPLKNQVFGDKKIDNKLPTLAEILKDDGYKTAGFISMNVISNKFNNIGKGFDLYEEVNEKDKKEDPQNTYSLYDSPIEKNNAQRAERTTNEAMSWLEKNNSGKFFLFLHYFDPHSPYDAPKPYGSKYSTADSNLEIQRKALNGEVKLTKERLEDFEAKYDEEIAYTDFYIGELLKKIESMDLYKNSLIIITADHGESFDHNYLQHGQRLYDSSVKIPFIIYDPNKKNPGRIKNPVSLIDIVPTLISRLKIEKNIETDGVDLTKLLNNQKIERDTVFSMTVPSLNMKEEDKLLKRIGFIGQQYLTITEEERLIYNENNNNKEMYAIKNDPTENNNIYRPENKEANSLFEKVILWLSQNKNIDTDNLKVKNEELYKTLKGLGYL